jgi:hypothetical protein
MFKAVSTIGNLVTVYAVDHKDGETKFLLYTEYGWRWELAMKFYPCKDSKEE